MKLSHWHKSNGDTIYLTRSVEYGLFEPDYDLVYGSAIFTKSQKKIKRLLANFPNAIVGGTGTNSPGATIEQIIGDYEHYDYSVCPDYRWSLGFTQRGCRLNCKFCVVPQKEGRPRSVNTIYDIWRPDTERKIVLLDNDFFGQPREQWQDRIEEIRSGDFKVSFNQGINIRLVDDKAAQALASIKYYDDQFKNRRLYTAWDNLKDEDIFFRGVDRLEQAGIPPYHLMVYMLIGFDPTETWERILYRFHKMNERGILPYPMVYNNKDKDLKRFQRWVVGRYYKIIPWEEYSNNGRQHYKKVPKEQLRLL
jgi:hypothetical protein